MITKLRAAFTRAKVNHPRKLIFGTPNAVAAMLIPFDGGASFLMTSALTGGWQIPSILITGGPFNTPGLEDQSIYKTPAKITHKLNDGTEKTYATNEAQRQAYQKWENKIRSLQRQFQYATNNQKRQKLLKEAQKLADKQQWLVDGLKEVDGTFESETPIEFKLQRGRSPRKNKRPGN